MSDDNNEEESSDEIASAVYALTSQAKLHMLISLVLLITSIAMIGVFIVILADGIKAVDKLVDLKPVNRFELFSVKIDDALTLADRQYAEHLDKVEDDSILTLSDKFKTIYMTSFESEQDNSKMILDYQQFIFKISSQTRGSGEWFQFHNIKLEKFIKNNNKRTKSLSRYVNRINVADSP